MAKEKLSQDELELLTPAERAAMEDPELEEDDSDDAPEIDEEDLQRAEAEEKTAKTKAESQDEEDDEDDPDDAQDEDEEQEDRGADEEEAAKEQEEAALADTEEEQPETDDLEQDFTPTRKPRNYLTEQAATAEIQKIDDALEDLDRRYDEGEEGLDRAKYSRERRKLEDKRMDFKDELRESNSVLRTWSEETVPTFIDKHPEYTKSKLLYETLNTKVKEIQISGDYDPFDPVVLRKAHAEVMKELKELNITVAGKEKAKGKEETRKTGTKKTGKKAPPPPSAERPTLPNVGKLPNASTGSEIDGGKFAYLDRLKGVEYEDALAKLSEAEQEEYLSTR